MPTAAVPQVCFSLLRKCIAFTHGVFLSRACSPRLVKGVLAKYGFISASCVFDIGWFYSQGFSVEANYAKHISWRYWSAFFRAACTCGILGIDHCVRIVGWMGCNSGGGFHVVLEMVRALTRRPQFGANNEYSNCSQHELSASIDDLQLKGLLDTLPKIDCARLRSCSSGGIASAWLTAVPSLMQVLRSPLRASLLH